MTRIASSVRWAVVLAAAGVLAGGAGQAAASSGIPQAVRGVLRTDALRTAKVEGDAHPRDIWAVLTTIAGAERATDCHCISYVPPKTEPIYLIAVRGHFSCNTCSHPPSGHIGPGTVITLECQLANPSVCPGFGFLSRYPNLKSAGTPVRLYPDPGKDKRVVGVPRAAASRRAAPG
jgi:hypothetical protein